MSERNLKNQRQNSAEMFAKKSPASVHVLGLGVTEKASFSEAAQEAIKHSTVIIGSERQLATVGHLLSESQQQLELPSLDLLKSFLNKNTDKTISLLASGDPLFYGIGHWLQKNISKPRIKFYPSVSSIQAACHLLGLSLQNVCVISLHGRPLKSIRAELKNNQHYIILTDKNSQPLALAKECVAAGYEKSELWVCEKLGYAEQNVRQFKVDDLLVNPELEFDGLHLSVIYTQGHGGKLPEFPGFPDELFITGKSKGKGMITRREVRLSILSLLQSSTGDVIWDIGAGCGSVAVELAYWNKNCHVTAIEQHGDRLTCLERNREKFGVVKNLKVINGRAPQALENLANPDKIFIGGSDGELFNLLTICWQKLPPGGVMVASAVTENSKNELFRMAEVIEENESDSKHQIESVQIAVSKADKLAGQSVYKPCYPVTIFKFEKRQVKNICNKYGVIK